MAVRTLPAGQGNRSIGPIKRCMADSGRELLPQGGPASYPKLHRWQTPVNGSLIHAILNATFIPYQEGIFNGEAIDREAYVQQLRNGLADRLSHPSGENKNSPTFYQLINKGSLAQKGRTEPGFSLEAIAKALRTAPFLGEVYFEYLSNYFKIDIFVIDLSTMDVILSKTPDNILFLGRDTILVGYVDKHYEMLSVKISEKQHATFFSPESPIIRKLWNRRLQLRHQLESQT